MIDQLLYQALGPLVAGRAYPDVAPQESALPRIVHQQIGGAGLAYTESTLPDHEGVRVQVTVWGTNRIAVTDLAKQAEAALLAAPLLQADPIGGRTSEYEDDTKLYGSRQDFYVWAPR